MNDERATVVVGSDHAGFEMKEFVKNYLSEKGYLYIDIGAPQEDPSDDYPVFAFKLAKTVSANK